MSSPLSRAWSILSQEGSTRRDEFRVMDSGSAAADGRALLAVDSLGLHHLLIPIRSGVHVDPDERSSGVHILGRELIGGDGTASFVDVVCRKPHLAEAFTHLVAEILEALPLEPGRPATVARRVLNRWRELLERERPGLLPESELVGLFGELWVLRILAERNPEAVSIWTGPERARADFQRGTCCLEVKTTTSLQQRLVHIHGVDQLEPPDASELYLLVITVERVRNAGMSVPGLVSMIRELGLDALTLSCKLEAVGYSEHDERHYADERFAVRSEVYFHVDAAFPRVVRSSFVNGGLPPCVGGLRYTIDLTAPPPEPLEESDVERVLGLLAG